MYRFRDMLLVAACAAACVGCDGEITVSGEVSDESGTPISEACLYLGDRRYDDALNEFLAGKDTDLACRSRTNGEGHFKMTSIVGGGGGSRLLAGRVERGLRNALRTSLEG